MHVNMHVNFLILTPSLFSHFTQIERVNVKMIARLLDLLPTRGPDAYGHFCVALLVGDHHHVAEKLKQEEGMGMIDVILHPFQSTVDQRLLVRERFLQLLYPIY